MTIETVTGNLRAAAQLEECTLQHWDELSRDQIRDKILQSSWFYVADFPLYTARGRKPVFALARHTKEHPNNLVLAHLFDAQNSSYDKLVHAGNFRPKLDEAQAALDAADTLKIEMSGLRLSGKNPISRFLCIRTEDGFVKISDGQYERPNEVEQALIQRVGYTEKFLNVLESQPYNHRETEIYLLNPDYVVAEAGEQFVGLAAWRSSFVGSSAVSIACDRIIVGYHGGLRGVLK